ncbi:hypothetical protein BJ165DRAFT_1335838 [Panaeolus papilionaceus]|nr:hypothetical protein BJ165DRAFT_1335838 [Panaeolus papilionaceus]
MYWCRCCRKEFSSRKARTQHWRDIPSHPYCHLCEKHFRGKGLLNKHALSVHSESYCTKCNLIFDTAIGLSRHHSRSVDHHYCAECEIDFDTASGLHHHKMSLTHTEQDVACGLRQCGESFVSHAALVLHWESGACKSGIDCADVHTLALQYDQRHTFSCPHDYNQPIVPIRSVCDWNNGIIYECITCARITRSHNEIITHFNNNHVDKLFVCPNRDLCDARFALLSGMTQHVLSNKCGAANMDELRMDLLSLIITIKVHSVVSQDTYAAVMQHTV